MRKGQLKVASVLVAVFVAPGFLIGMLKLEDMARKEIEYASGDSETVAEAKVEKELLPGKLRRELKYSRNIVATGSSLSWDSVPSRSSIRGSYASRIESELKTQRFVKGCQGPDVSSVSINGGIKASTSGSVKCQGQFIRVSVPASFEVSAPKAGFLSVAYEARDVAGDSLNADLGEVTASGSAESDCVEEREDADTDSVRSQARSGAEFDAWVDYKREVAEALGDYSYSWGNVSFSVSGSHSGSSEWTSCDLEKPASEVEGESCSGQQGSDEQKRGSRGGSRNPDSGEDEEQSCTVKVEGEQYTHETTFTADSATYTFWIADEDTTLTTSEGDRAINLTVSIQK